MKKRKQKRRKQKEKLLGKNKNGSIKNKRYQEHIR